jgi:hypothetical protein
MDLYVVLGVRQDASESEIKRAYRRLARRFHPDINPGDHAAAEHFQQVVEAYETLIDRERRVRYDSGEATAAPAEARRGGFEGFDFSSRGPDYSATFGDLVAEVLIEHGARRPAAARGADLHQDVDLSFAESFNGCERALAVTRREDVPPVPRRRRGADGAWAVRSLPGAGRRAHRARAHGVHAELQCLRRHGAAAAAAVPVVRGRRPRSAGRARHLAPACRHRRRRARAGRGEGGTRALAAVRRATCTSRCTWPPTRISAGTAAIYTSCCRSRCTRPRSARGWRLRGSTAR